ncbi:MAG: glycosyltransferase family 9 protein [Candidatus Desulfacyla sp.]
MRRVLIIRPGALGDTMMLLPALNDLADKVIVTFVGRHPGLDFIRPHVDRAMDLEASGWHRLFMDTPDKGRLPVSEKDLKITAAFFSDPDGVIRRNLQASLPHADVHVFRSFPMEGEDVHVAEYLARCLASAGLPVDPAQVVQGARDGALCQRAGFSATGKRIVLHPGSGSLKKNHPPGFWLDLISRLSKEAGFADLEPVLLLGPAEAPLHPYFKDAIEAGAIRSVLSEDRETLTRTLDEAILFLGHDSGVTHLSAMRCVPTVALFKHSDATQWGPLGPFVRIIETRDPGPGLLDHMLQAARELVAMDRSSP